MSEFKKDVLEREDLTDEDTNIKNNYHLNLTLRFLLISIEYDQTSF